MKRGFWGDNFSVIFAGNPEQPLIFKNFGKEGAYNFPFTCYRKEKSISVINVPLNFDKFTKNPTQANFLS